MKEKGKNLKTEVIKFDDKDILKDLTHFSCLGKTFVEGEGEAGIIHYLIF